MRSCAHCERGSRPSADSRARVARTMRLHRRPRLTPGIRALLRVAVAPLLLGVLVTLTIARNAVAQEDAAAPHLAAARAAAKRRDWPTALAQFSAAEALEESLDALQGIADAHYHLAHDGEAYDAYEQVLHALSQSGVNRKKRAATGRATADRLRELAGRTGTIAVAVGDPGASVYVDDRALGTSPLSTVVHAGVGSHRVHAEGPSGTRAEQQVEVAAGSSSVVELHLVKPQTNLGAAAGGTPPAPAASGQPGGTGGPGPPAGGTAAPPRVSRDAWDVPHGSVYYRAFRAKTPPRIDGVLDDSVWKDAPRDSHFLSTMSKPYGQPTTEPTTVQVAYDDEYLYVAATMQYSSVRPRDDSFPTDELAAIARAESFGVLVDPLHDHTNALAFFTTRVGARADAEATQSGEQTNEDWRGIWDVEVQRSRDWWTAEFRIPWGTLRLPRHEEPFTVGIQFRRTDPTISEEALWSLEPRASSGDIDTNYFGHLENLEHVRPGLRLYIQPYVAVAYDQQAGTLRSRLSDFAGTQSNLRTYAGLYARYTPPGPLRVEVTANPDFSAVPPDQAVANFDRFELQYPEVRPFFAEDNPRFFFGVPGAAQLFYSRRIGLTTDPQTGATSIVPIVYGGKVVVRTSGAEVAAMNVGLSTPDPKVTLADNVSVLRFSQSFAGGSQVGTILLGRQGPAGTYGAGGVDGRVALYDRHLILSGFYARTATEGQTPSGMGQAQLGWTSEDFYANASYMDIGSAFDAQLGFVPITGIRSNVFAAGYTPVLRSDLVQQLWIEGSGNFTKDRNDVRVYDRGVVSGRVDLLHGGTVQVQALPSIENVLTPFPLFAGRLTVPAGQYNVMDFQATVKTAPRRPVVFGVGYLTGDLFGGQRQSPSVTLGLNLGRFSSKTLYQLFLVRYGSQEFIGHQVSGTAGYSYTPLARTTLVVQANTLIDRAVVQLVTSYTFGLLSTLSLVLVRTTGTTEVPVEEWVRQSNLSAILSFTYGLSPF